MNHLNQLFSSKKDLLSIYFTAGFPEIDSTVPILQSLEKAGVDFVEIGMPFSDPLADGRVIQNSGSRALKNGMSLKVLFEQLKDVRKKVTMPIVLMGYINPVLRFGMDRFIEKCVETGINGVIIPDLPFELYNEKYRSAFEIAGLSNIFLITPQTPEERVRKLDDGSNTFLYMVSSAAVTGAQKGLSDFQLDYFSRIRDMNLKTPCVVGFGISNHTSYKRVCDYAHGAIIGSAFVNMIEKSEDLDGDIQKFIGSVLKPE